MTKDSNLLKVYMIIDKMEETPEIGKLKADIKNMLNESLRISVLETSSIVDVIGIDETKKVILDMYKMVELIEDSSIPQHVILKIITKVFHYVTLQMKLIQLKF